MNAAMFPAQLRAWIYAVANDRTRTQPSNTEDAAQEGMIAAWEAWQHRPGDTGYAMGAARHAIIGYATGHQKSFGHVGHRGWQETVRVYTAPVDLPEPVVPDRPSDLAYHRAEIKAAMGDFTPRQRQVVYQVALGVPLTANGYRTEWHSRLRPRLADRLAHLRGVA